MLVPTQPQNRPQLPPKIRIIIAWMIWLFFTLQTGVVYFVAWVAVESPSSGGTFPVQTLVIIAGFLGLISLALMSYRRSRAIELQKRFILLLIGMVVGEPISIIGMLFKFSKQVPDIALGLLITCAVIQVLNIPTDFKLPAEPQPSTRDDLGLPPSIG